MPCVFDSCILIEACYEEFGEPSADVRRQLEEFRKYLVGVGKHESKIAPSEASRDADALAGVAQ